MERRGRQKGEEGRVGEGLVHVRMGKERKNKGESGKNRIGDEVREMEGGRRDERDISLLQTQSPVLQSVPQAFLCNNKSNYHNIYTQQGIH